MMWQGLEERSRVCGSALQFATIVSVFADASLGSGLRFALPFFVAERRREERDMKKVIRVAVLVAALSSLSCGNGCNGEVDRPPEVTSTPVTTATVGAAYSYDVEATGKPAPTYSLTVKPSGMTIDPATGLITWTPAVGQGGLHDIVVTAANAGGTDDQSFQVAVSEAPAITSTAVTTAKVGAAYSYDVEASGYPAVAYSLSVCPDGMTIDAATGIISWTPWVWQEGDNDVTVVASNGVEPDAAQSFTISVASGTWDWVERFPSHSPPARCGFGMAYDAARGVTVLFGGEGLRSDTWEYDGVDWTEIQTTTSPPGRLDHKMAYDSQRSVVVLFGGNDGGLPADTWEYDGNDWTQRSPGGSPPAREKHDMAYDAARGVVVLFGGYSATGNSDDTWEWNGTDWTKRKEGEPTARSFPGMAFDARRGVTVLFGGGIYATATMFGDTWEWNGTDWTQRASGTPPARAWVQGAMAYNSRRGTTMLFSGYEYGGTLELDDTWEWDGTTWTQLSPTTTPPKRYDCNMVYDEARGVLVMFGGYDGAAAFRGDTWEFGLQE